MVLSKPFCHNMSSWTDRLAIMTSLLLGQFRGEVKSSRDKKTARIFVGCKKPFIFLSTLAPKVYCFQIQTVTHVCFFQDWWRESHSPAIILVWKGESWSKIRGWCEGQQSKINLKRVCIHKISSEILKSWWWYKNNFIFETDYFTKALNGLTNRAGHHLRVDGTITDVRLSTDSPTTLRRTIWLTLGFYFLYFWRHYCNSYST